MPEPLVGGEDESVNGTRTAFFQGSRARVEGGARGDYVVDEEDEPRRGRPGPQEVGPLRVRPALAPPQTLLLVGWSPLEGPRDGASAPLEKPGDFLDLVPTPAPRLSRTRGDGHDDPSLPFPLEGLREKLRKKGRETAPSLRLIRRHQVLHRSGIGEKRMDRVESPSRIPAAHA